MRSLLCLGFILQQSERVRLGNRLRAHPITKPRENHAVMHQNLAWFSHYLLGEKLALE